jgi:hypothetical protein
VLAILDRLMLVPIATYVPTFANMVSRLKVTTNQATLEVIAS